MNELTQAIEQEKTIRQKIADMEAARSEAQAKLTALRTAPPVEVATIEAARAVQASQAEQSALQVLIQGLSQQLHAAADELQTAVAERKHYQVCGLLAEAQTMLQDNAHLFDNLAQFLQRWDELQKAIQSLGGAPVTWHGRLTVVLAQTLPAVRSYAPAFPLSPAQQGHAQTIADAESVYNRLWRQHNDLVSIPHGAIFDTGTVEKNKQRAAQLRLQVAAAKRQLETLQQGVK